jgi:hypothetical protein
MTLLGSMLAACLALWIDSAPEAESESAAEGDAAGAAAAETGAAAFVGKFGFVGGQHQRDLVAEAIERAVQSLPAFHHVARTRLTEANPIPSAVRISMDGDDVVVVYGDQDPQRAPLDGSPRTWRNRAGKTVELRHALRGGKLVQTIRGEEGRRVMVWSFDPERELLRVKCTMSGTRLPEPVRYRLSFKKR